MKQILTFLFLLSVVQVSCKKPDSCDTAPTSLDGRWRMLVVKDNASGASTQKPTSLQTDVNIIFTSTTTTNGTFIGNTPSNDIQPSDYSVGQNRSLEIPNLNMTKVVESSWGREFVDNIRSAQEYQFDCGKLNIKTANKRLTFEKF